MLRRQSLTPAFAILLGAALCALPASEARAGNVTQQPSVSGPAWTLTWPDTAGTNGYVLTTDGTGITSWTPPGAAGAASLSSITSATTTSSIDNTNNAITWKWGTLTTQTALSLTTSSMTTGTLVSLSNTATGAGAGIVLSVSNTEAGGWALVATGASYFNGSVGIGTTDPNTTLDVNGVASIKGCSGVGCGGPIGVLRRGKMSVTAASSTGTFTADQINVATALNGTFYNLSSYSQAIDLGTTGAGGMDTGTAPASGFVALYAIYNPTTPATSILACAVATSTASIYGGANMPAGYTASALIGIWPTNASRQFVPGLILDRHFSYRTAVQVMGAITGVGILTSQSVSAGVPVGAVEADFVLTSQQSGGSYLESALSGDGIGTGEKFVDGHLSSDFQNIGYGLAANTYYGAATFVDIPMITAQTVYWQDSNINSSDYLFAIGYRF